jgi:hypothetical protein
MNGEQRIQSLFELLRCERSPRDGALGAHVKPQ